MKDDLQLSYTTVGHVTVDVMADGSRQPGGSAFYGALQASRLGLRASILTRGLAGEIEALIAPYRGELDVHVQAAPCTTTLRTCGAGDARKQHMLCWAGPIAAAPRIDTSILHLAPVARETPAGWRGRPRLVGLTAQGLARAWDGPDAQVRVTAPARDDLRVAARCEALVVSEHEREACAQLIERAVAAGATAAITAGERPSTLVLAGGAQAQVPVPRVESIVDDLGAGDVFAAALFVALAEGRSPLDAARFANAAAAVRIGGLGAGAIGDRAAVQARLRATAEASG